MVLAGSLAMSGSLSAQGAGSVGAGSVTGRAVQAGTGTPLVGAAVTVDGTPLSAITQAGGRFLLPRVPAGDRTLTLTFIGHENLSRPVTVRSGETSSVDFTVGVAPVALEGITVLGARAMVQAEALSRQKNAPNIINVVASDQMGRFPDASAPEAVQRIPGIAIARDQGEGRYIQIRGGSAANTQVTFNGLQIPSPEGDARQIALDAVPVDILESIEVSKALLPDMDADAIGGSVNLVTRRAPAARLFSMEAAGGFAPIRDEPAGSGTMTYGSRSADGRFGYLVNGSWSHRSFGSDDLEPVYDLGDEGPSDDVLEELEVRHYSLSRQRLGGTASLDYRFDETSALGLTAIFTNMTDTEQRRRLISVVEDGELEWQHKNRQESLRTYSVALDGEHLLGGATLDYRVGWTRSLEHTPFDTEIAWILEDVSFSPSISDPDDIRSNPSTIAGSYLFDSIEPASSDTEDTDRVGQVDLSLPFALGEATGRLKFGAKIRDKNKVRNVVEEAYELEDGDLILGVDYGEPFGESLRDPGNYALPEFGTSPDQVTAFVDRFRSRLEHEVDLEAETEDYDLDERVLAAYVMAEINVTPSFLLLPGVRFEQTRVETRGNEWDSEEETLTAVTGARSYEQVFPMLHARWAVGRNTNLRGAFTTTLQRPNFFDLVPYRVRDDEDLALGNPSLEPMIARSFDALFEHYNRRIGVVSAGLFYKDVTDPIFSFIEENALGGDTEQPRNGRSGWIRGVEMALQRPLGGGFGVYGNYTFTDSEAELPNGRIARLQGQSDHVFNAAISYDRSGFASQVSVNHHNSYVEEYAEEAFEDVYIDNHIQLDVTASYQVNGRSRVFLELINLTNEPLVAYQGIRERPIQMEYYGVWGRLGVRMAW
jgi:TonB-dependent receptor